MQNENLENKSNSPIAALFRPDVETLTSGKLIYIRREHAIDGYDKYDSTLTTRFWIRAGFKMMKVFVKSDEQYDDQPFLANISYSRDDASAAIKAPVNGVTLMVASPIIKNGKDIQLSILFDSKEILVINIGPKATKFVEFVDGLNYDLTRTRLNFETYTYTKEGDNLVKFISGAWQLYIANEKNKYSIIDFVKGKPKYSIVTVFYKNTALVGMYPMLASVLELGPDFEVIFCFQEALLFKKQIDWLCSVAENLKKNIKIIMFEDNTGFSNSNNVAVEKSVGSVVMLLNPDIISNDANIYEKIMKVAENQNAIVGASLMGTSGDIMHNGIDFEKELSFDGKKPFSIVRTYHIDRHLGGKLIHTNKLKQAKATSGALIAVKKGIWEKLGGLSEKYVYAHFEDVDFCLRAEKINIPCLIYQNVALTHIESYSSGESGMSNTLKLVNSNLYNRSIEE